MSGSGSTSLLTAGNYFSLELFCRMSESVSFSYGIHVMYTIRHLTRQFSKSVAAGLDARIVTDY